MKKKRRKKEKKKKKREDRNKSGKSRVDPALHWHRDSPPGREAPWMEERERWRRLGEEVIWVLGFWCRKRKEIAQENIFPRENRTGKKIQHRKISTPRSAAGTFL